MEEEQSTCKDKLTVKDVMKEFGLSEKKTRELFSNPEFPAQKFTKPMFVLRSELLKYFSIRHEKIVKE